MLCALAFAGCKEQTIDSAPLFALEMTINMGDKFSENIAITADKGNIAANVVYDSEMSAVQAMLSDFDSTKNGPRSSHEYTLSITGSNIGSAITIRIVTDVQWYGLSKIYDVAGNEIDFNSNQSNTEIEFSL